LYFRAYAARWIQVSSHGDCYNSTSHILRSLDENRATEAGQVASKQLDVTKPATTSEAGSEAVQIGTNQFYNVLALPPTLTMI
jgi:hypothetical protein